MKKNTALTTRELIRTLIRFNKTTQAKVVDGAGLVRQNVSSWLTGRDDAITEEKIVQLLYALGVSSGLPRTDVLHRWCIENVDVLASVLATVTHPELEVSLYKVHLPTHPGSAILKIENPIEVGGETAWILLYRSPVDLNPKPINAKSIGLRAATDMAIDQALWESWLPPNEIDIKEFHVVANSLTLHAQLSSPLSDERGLEKLMVMYSKALKKMPAGEILAKVKFALGL